MKDLKDDVTAWLRQMLATADIDANEQDRYFAIGGDCIRDDGALVCEHGTYIVELRLAQDATCTDHWHCDPTLAAHECSAPERSFPCPSCGAEVRS